MLTRRAVDDLGGRLGTHLSKLKMGALFDSYTAEWTSGEAADFLDCIEEMCHILDVKAPQLIEEAWNDRRMYLGLAPCKGAILRSYTQKALAHGTYLEMMTDNCAMLRKASMPAFACGWNQKGCQALHDLLICMMEAIKTSLFNILYRLMSADVEFLQGMLRSSEPHIIPG
ncbi:hypothetical protein [Pseudosulfitobacter pseudonitzschiae]|uniref:hypothetical protein n=1 Tax=Pseudosulfitobacter pseudonitzschiae TaxID=1402135 RepID=UPI003B801B9E